jgi:hypothetical protein
MLSKADSAQLAVPPATASIPALSNKRPKKRLYALAAGIIAIAVIAALLFVPQSLGTSIKLGLNYSVGEKMVYDTTNIVTNQMYNTSINMATSPMTESYNSTSSYEVLSLDGETYTLNVTITSIILGRTISLPVTTKVNKASYYNDFLPSGAPQFFSNVSANPTLSAYLAKPEVNLGDTWQIPVSTGNSSLGLTGDLTLKFGGIQEITVPAGTYKVFKIDISSDNLVMHVDLESDILNLNTLNNANLRISGQTYLEYETCRLIKSDLQQETTFQATGVNGTSSIYTQRVLVEHTKP